MNSSVDPHSVLDSTSVGDEILFEDGMYISSCTHGVLSIARNITIRALNPGKAVLDGRKSMRVIFIVDGAVLLDGLKFTRASPMWSNAIPMFPHLIAASSANETSETIPMRIVAGMSALEKVVLPPPPAPSWLSRT